MSAQASDPKDSRLQISVFKPVLLKPIVHKPILLKPIVHKPIVHTPVVYSNDDGIWQRCWRKPEQSVGLDESSHGVDFVVDDLVRNWPKKARDLKRERA